jgi:hypothetical protein
MSRRIIVLILVLMVVFAGNLSAQERTEKNTASEFDIGVVMNYSYADLRDLNLAGYIPTLRFQLNVLPWLGFSATGYARGQEFVSVVVEAVLRAPLGRIEPYIATGPGYLLALTDDIEVSGTSHFAYNFRAGFDINITDWFSLGPGVTLLIPDVTVFFDDFSSLGIQYLKETILIGFGGKLRF